jgi:hypothetical protein
MRDFSHAWLRSPHPTVSGKNPASVRRLLTASGNPELRTVVAMANALDADIKIVRRSPGRARRTAA